MKQSIYLLIATLSLIACNSGKNNSGDRTCPKPIEEFITDLYDNYVFNYGELDSIAGNFSPTVLDRLHRAYVAEYDGEFTLDDPGYAVWLFRTSQNGSEEQTIDSIKMDGNDHYTVYLTDGDIPCTCQMHIVMQDDIPVLMDFNTEYEIH